MRHIPRHLLLAILPFAFAVPALAQEQQPVTDVLIEDAAEADYSALSELFPDGLPSLLAPQSVASAYRLPAGVQPDAKKKAPTRIEYTDGSLKWDVGTNVVTHKAATTIVPAIPDPRIVGGAAGGAGEVKGQLRYVGTEWEFYGIQSFGANQADGSLPTLHETTTIGSLYKLPGEMAGGRIGTSFVTNSAHHRTTRIEYRQPFGSAEGFIAAERTFLPDLTDHKPPAAIRAGVNRKF
jgi:hypothetical protein